MRHKSAKEKLTIEITDWIQQKIDDINEPDPILNENETYSPNDFFFQDDSLRLRYLGYKILTLYFDHETFEHSRNFHANELLILAKHMTSPFYISGNRIVLFNQEDIVLAKLAEDVTSWLNNFD